MIPKTGFALLLATCGVAFAVSGTKAPSARAKGLALFEKGDCGGAIPELLRALAEGDSSHVLVLNLAQALECDGRSVDALSATYVDAKTDTAGRIDVLLYRAQLLRQLGLDDEAEAVEREAGSELAEEAASGGWSAGWGISGGTGWAYDYLAKTPADSARWIAYMSSGIYATSSEVANAADSMEVVGAQIPVSATISYSLAGERHYIALEMPGQVTMGASLDRWLAASVGGQFLASSNWGARWSTLLYLGADRSWYPVDGEAPTFQTSAFGQLGGSWAFAEGSASLGSSFGSTWDEQGKFLGCTVGHSAGIGRELPGGIAGSASVGYSWYFDDSRYEHYELDRTIIMVSGAKPYISNKDNSLLFLDTAGKPIPWKNRFELADLINGEGKGQWLDLDTPLEYPASNPEDWTRWNVGLALGRKHFKRLTWRLSGGVSRTAWGSAAERAYLSEDVLLESNTLYFYKDIATGEEFWVRNPANTNLVPLLYKRRRVDWTGTVGLAARFEASDRLGFAVGWSGIRNRSNLEHVLEGSSYTRSVWNASATVSW